MKRTLGALVLLLALTACGGNGEAPEPGATATIGVPAACLLVEDTAQAAIELMGAASYSPSQETLAEGYAEDMRETAAELGPAEPLAEHLEQLATGMDDLAALVRGGGGELDAAGFKASAAEVATVCGWV